MQFDVVIVGGRPAGASLAIRLGREGLNVLVLDRATFPSKPTVPSSPAVHPGAMKLLDELGISEDGYGAPTARIEAAVMQFDGHFTARFAVPLSHGRSYYFGVERQRFDELLWTRLDAFPSVQRLEQTTFVDVLRSPEGRVTGITLRSRGGAQSHVRAKWVIGADGRYSAVARAVSAKLLDDRSEHASTVYYADWVGARPLRSDSPHAMTIVTNAAGTNVLCFPMPDGRLCVNTHQRAALANPTGNAQASYEVVLRSLSGVREMLAGARQVSELAGIKRIANRIVQPSGAGWALVGDAFHCKDPIDGQGIYDALMESRLLATWLLRSVRGDCSAEDAETGYATDVLAAVTPMFEHTCGRLKTELYGTPPPPIIRTVIRWTMTDPRFQDRFYRTVTRDLDPRELSAPGLRIGSLVRGAWKDLTRRSR